jgi:phage terminase large subunit GpA-like protein
MDDDALEPDQQDTLDDILDRIEREEYESLIAPTTNPRDLLTFAEALMVPSVNRAQVSELYQPRQHLVQLAILTALGNPRWRRFVIVACTQDGKTWLMSVLLFWIACEQKEAVIWGGPDMRIAQDTYRQKIEPAFDASGLASFKPSSGAGSGGGTDVETVQLTGGGLIIFLGAGGKNKSGQAGRTARWVIVDEFGKVKPELSSKFDRRADAFDIDGRLIKAGTVETDDADQMLDEYELSSRGRMHWRCHICGMHGPLEWEQVDADWTSEVSAASSVRIHCARCGAPWTDQERKANLLHGVEVHAGQTVDADGTVQGELPATYTYGMRWSALDSPRRSLTKLAADYVLAKHKADRGDHQPLVDFYHDQLSRRFPRQSDDQHDLDAQSLAARSAAGTFTMVQVDGASSQWVVAVVPDGVEFVTMAVDQSKRRLWYVIRGHDRDGRRWHLGWGRIPICGDLEEPTTIQRHAGLDQLDTLRERGLTTADGSVMPISIVGIDVGYEPSATLDWVREHHSWIPVRGTGDRLITGMQAMPPGTSVASVPGWYNLREYAPKTGRQYEILWIDSDAVKTEASRSFRRAIDATGAALLPRGLDVGDHLIAHLTGERWMAMPGGKFAWVKVARFVDWWDCTYYTDALARYLADRYPERAQRVLPAVDAADDQADDQRGGSLGW